VSVAVLCTPPRARAAAAVVALALARGLGARCALAAVAGVQQPASSFACMPSVRRASAALRGSALPVSASGRLVWLADRRGPLPGDDPAGHAAALSVELGHAAAAVGAPAAVALPMPRTDALDRVLAWHDAIVVVPEPDAVEGVVARALAELAGLGRPVVAIAPPRRTAGALAVAGVVAPPEAVAAVAGLLLGAEPWNA
jgi:hypothetical protein